MRSDRPLEQDTIESNNLPLKNYRIESAVDTRVFLRLILALESARHLNNGRVINRLRVGV